MFNYKVFVAELIGTFALVLSAAWEVQSRVARLVLILVSTPVFFYTFDIFPERILTLPLHLVLL
jgi:hypothetical protein